MRDIPKDTRSLNSFADRYETLKIKFRNNWSDPFDDNLKDIQYCFCFGRCSEKARYTLKCRRALIGN